jgi:hypothetical protein
MAATVWPGKKGSKVTPEMVTAAAPRQDDRCGPHKFGRFRVPYESFRDEMERVMRYGG